jgi:hypothetical protein
VERFSWETCAGPKFAEVSQASAWLLQASFPTVAWWPVRL